jgi:hypothetical protein
VPSILVHGHAKGVRFHNDQCTNLSLFDPVQDWLFEKLTREEIFQVLEVGFKYQKRLIDLEIEGLKAQAEVLGEMQKVITGFK